MVLPHFDYVTPESKEQVSKLLLKYGDKARVMAGATDLIIPMKDGAVKPVPEVVIDLKKLDGMRELEYDNEAGLTIGALTTLREIEFSDLVWEKNPAVATASKSIASTQIRAKGTIAGNICNASPSCDSGPMLVASGAKVKVFGPEGEREVKGEDFFVSFKKTALKPGEFVTAIVYPPLKPNQKAAYMKHAVRKAMDLAIVGVAAVVTVQDGICTDAAIGLGAVAVTPIRAPKAEEILIGSKLTPEVIEEAAQAAMDSCAPISDIRASKEYRAAMVKVFTKRAINQCLEQM